MHLKDGRPCHFLPWAAQTPQPWGAGYARVFVPYTESERRHQRNLNGNGHVLVVKVDKLVQDNPDRLGLKKPKRKQKRKTA